MSLKSLIKSIGVLALTVTLFAGCSGGTGDMNFTIEGNNWKNWPWPWQFDADVFAFRTYSRNVFIAGHTHFRIDGVNGEIEIIGDPTVNTVTVNADVRVGSDSYADALLGLNKLEISLTDGSGEITIQSVQPDDTLGRQYIIDYTLTIPSSLPVSVNLVNGYVSVNDMENSIFVVLDNGNVSFSNIHGEATVNMDNGSFSGDISLPFNGEAIIATTNGDIDLLIPVTTTAELFGHADNGTINWSSFVMGNVQTTNKTLHGTLGNGSGLVDLKTVNGNIEITGFN